MHQLPPEETGEFDVDGAVIGTVEDGEYVSGLESGFKIGDVEIVGTKFGIVVIGVVISLLVVLTCPCASLFVSL